MINCIPTPTIINEMNDLLFSCILHFKWDICRSKSIFQITNCDVIHDALKLMSSYRFWCRVCKCWMMNALFLFFVCRWKKYAKSRVFCHSFGSDLIQSRFSWIRSVCHSSTYRRFEGTTQKTTLNRDHSSGTKIMFWSLLTRLKHVIWFRFDDSANFQFDA